MPSRGVWEMIVGGLEVGAGLAVGALTGNIAAGLALAEIGYSTIAAGAVTDLTSKAPKTGSASTEKNSVAPWKVCCGRVRNGGVLVYDFQWGANNNVRDLVIVLAAHSCQIDAAHPITLLFDRQRVQIDTSAIPTVLSAGFGIPLPNQCSGTSFTPVQQTINISSISRSNDVVSVVLNTDIPYLIAGDQIIIQNVPGDLTLNGTFQIAGIVEAPGTHVGGMVGAGANLTFTFLSGGKASSVSAAGEAVTKWADYGRNVYLEVMNGTQSLGETFIGMRFGTPYQGTGFLGTPEIPHQYGGTGYIPQPNPWYNFCSLQGKTAVFLRIQYMQKYFPYGLPQISFLHYGKNDIYDPRLGDFGAPGTRIYTENPALIAADFLHMGAPNSAPWSPSTIYSPGMAASFGKCDYVSFANSNLGQQPDTSPAFWQPVTPSRPIMAYEPGAIYSAGQIVRYVGLGYLTGYNNQYISLINSNLGNTPGSSPGAWAALPVPVQQLCDVGYGQQYA